MGMCKLGGRIVTGEELRMEFQDIKSTCEMAQAEARRYAKELQDVRKELEVKTMLYHEALNDQDNLRNKIYKLEQQIKAFVIVRDFFLGRA